MAIVFLISTFLLPFLRFAKLQTAANLSLRDDERVRIQKTNKPRWSVLLERVGIPQKNVKRTIIEMCDNNIRLPKLLILQKVLADLTNMDQTHWSNSYENENDIFIIWGGNYHEKTAGTGCHVLDDRHARPGTDHGGNG